MRIINFEMISMNYIFILIHTLVTNSGSPITVGHPLQEPLISVASTLRADPRFLVFLHSSESEIGV